MGSRSEKSEEEDYSKASDQRKLVSQLMSLLSVLQFPSSRAILLETTLPLNDPTFRVRYTILLPVLCPLSNSP